MRKLTIGSMAVLCVLGAGAGLAQTPGVATTEAGPTTVQSSVRTRARAPVPQTGQEVCYDPNANEIPNEIFCRGTGQDGEFQFGVPIPTPRYSDNGDGTIRDNLTGLIWLKNANCPKSGRTWQQALDDVKSLNSAGTMNGNDCGDTSGRKGSHRTDWRLPNTRELFSLIDFAFTLPAISNAAGTGRGSSSDPFTDFQTGSTAYWSSTTTLNGPTRAWVVGVANGDIAPFDKHITAFFVLAVRGGD
jgi:Protein of unknown function (DUF1566)